ncbi:chemosensory receptor B [Elysia marginata]|uniref:Chemosensory receptor B n=1 Tax=Elysia marginata TaxID=1093978 RepID=A0AAV4GWF7_9GAST|nr:chemosensory receptor B [Elysia marginata]
MDKNNFLDGECFMRNSVLVTNLCFNETTKDDTPEKWYRNIMECISHAMLSISAVGIPGNILVVIVYVKIGFSESINISYFALGISDTIALLFITWNALCYIPIFVKANLPFIPTEIVVITGGATNDCFSFITAWITTFISFQRCLCVMRPLKVKRIITHQRSLLCILTIFTINITITLGVYLNVYQFVPRLDEKRNRTQLGLTLVNTSESDFLYNFSFVYESLISKLLPLILILACSITLVVHMKRQASWRLAASHQASNQNGITAAHEQRAIRKYAADMRVSKTVLCIAVASCILGALNAVRSLLAVVIPGFRPMQAFKGEYRLVSRILLFVSGINSSVNVIIYYRMGSKFRRTLKRLFGLKEKEDI